MKREKRNKGIVDIPRSQRHPKFGITINAKTIPKHAPNAQKHCGDKKKI